jgi:hypothetical protein
MTTDKECIEKIRDALSDLRESSETLDEFVSERISYNWVIEVIGELPDFKIFKCCNKSFKIDSLSIYATCPICNVTRKLRGFDSERSIEDVVNTALNWAKRDRHIGKPEEIK